jgi:ADP-ribose pyrophosphatase YjhB (NUDIX family)
MIVNLVGKLWKALPRQVRTAITRRTQAKFTISVAGIITDESGKVLLLNHVLRPLSGWGVPGGFMDFGEQPEAALRREVLEETGLELANVRLYRCRAGESHIEVIFTARGIGKATVKTLEITELGWFKPDNMPPAMSLDQHFLIREALGRGSSENSPAHIGIRTEADV